METQVVFGTMPQLPRQFHTTAASYGDTRELSDTAAADELLDEGVKYKSIRRVGTVEEDC